MNLRCIECGSSQLLTPQDLSQHTGCLTCQNCHSLVTEINTDDFSDWIDHQVLENAQLMARGQLRTRKQTDAAGDTDIDRDGMSAGIAACAIFCPRHIREWQARVESDLTGANHDLLPEWTGLSKPIRTRFTRYFSASTGYLLERPASGRGSMMSASHVADVYYVLMDTTIDGHMMARGWIDRAGFIERHKANPVPVRAGQCECWGVLWSNLLPFSDLVSQR